MGNNKTKLHSAFLKIFPTLVLTIILCVLSSVSVAAEESSTVTVINTVGLNNIHIELNQFDVINDKKVPITELQGIVPGQTINRISEVSNLANVAWIRVRVEYQDDFPPVDDSFFSVKENWQKHGDYYYYLSPVDTNETICFFDHINIPTSWGNEMSDKTLVFTVHADAVQTANFTPDFKDEDPWFGTVIEHRVRDNYIIPAKNNNVFEIKYENGADGLVKVGDDFFSNWGALMPGDKVSDKVTLKNNYAFPTEIYFRTETIDNSELLNKLILRIYTKNMEIYNGTMDGKVKNKILLAKLSHNETIELMYELTVPPELTNKFSLTKTKTKWIFSAYTENMKPSEDAESYTSPSNTPQPQPQPQTPQEGNYSFWKGDTIQTGETAVAVLCASAVIVLLLAVFFLLRRRRSDSDE